MPNSGRPGKPGGLPGTLRRSCREAQAVFMQAYDEAACQRRERSGPPGRVRGAETEVRGTRRSLDRQARFCRLARDAGLAESAVSCWWPVR